MTKSEKDAKYYKKHRTEILARVKAYALPRREHLLLYGKLYGAELKLEVLTHYGPSHHLMCSWPDCGVIDPDVLTIDHIANNGAEERKRGESHCGKGLYLRLRRENFPEGFQTLCSNHQLKKEVMRRRGES